MKNLNKFIASISTDIKEQRRLALLFHALEYQEGGLYFVENYGIRNDKLKLCHRQAIDLLVHHYQIDQSQHPDIVSKLACLKFLRGDS